MKPIHSPLREKSFFRKTSNALLKRFFEHYETLREIAWSGRAEADVDDVYDAYSELPEDTRRGIANDLENLNDLASERGMPCLVEAAGRWHIDCGDMTAHNLAMTLFLEHRDTFNTAHDWWTIDHFQGYSDFRGRNPLVIEDTDKGLPQLQAAFSDYLGSLEKGVDVKVEVYKDIEKIAYVVCHEDYVKAMERFREHTLVVENDRPVFYATMVYYPSSGKLKVKATKNELVEFSRDAFAEHIIGSRDFFQHQDVRLIYDLDRFKLPWQFELDPADHIEYVRVVAIRFHPELNTKDTVEVRSYRDLAQRLRGMNVDLNRVKITHVSLCFKFPGKGRIGARTVNLSMPNRNNLGDSKNDQLIERYLVEWKIANM
ncbi:MAG TPA: hypothetical protein VMX94_07040 [Armatimonadota bacterium]|nr:hypothetical protein [Thermoguttaceae bacterium]HUV04847.1 hypothetical protein [Armatimonadota bacterium]